MPRISQDRPPATPATPAQVDRQRAMLLAAAQLGAQQGLDEVQMAHVADRAGVALGTLYRYYPSKHHLFAGLLTMRTAELAAPAGRGAAAAADLLGGACRSLLARPRLATAMLTAINVVRARDGASHDTGLRDLIARVAGTEDLALARIVEQTAYGVLTWAAAGEISAEQAEIDIRRACHLLLAAA